MFKKRLVAAIVSIFAIGVVFGIFLCENGALSFCALFAALSFVSAIVVSFFFKNNSIIASKRVKAVALAVAAFSFGILRIYAFDFGMDSYERYNKKEDTALFQISEINASYVDVKVLSSEIGVPNGTNVRFYNADISNNVIVGDQLKANVTYKQAYKRNLLSNGTRLSASGAVLSENKGSGFFYNIRKSVFENSDGLYGKFEDASSIAKAVTIGDRTELDSYTYSIYKTAGLSHVLAISGLHISLISMSLFALLNALSLGRKTSGIVASLVAIVYTALVGFTAGAVRSAVMLLAIMISRIFLRRADSLTFLFFSLGGLLLINPFSICSIGLQLSFLCTFGIVVFEPMLNDLQSYSAINKYKVGKSKRILLTILPAIVLPISISFITSVFTFPVTCFGFDAFSYISPLTNIICVPLFAFAVKLALLAFLIAPFLPYVAEIIAYPSGLIFDFVSDIARWLHNADFGIVSVHIPLMVIPFVLSLAIIGVLAFKTDKKGKYLSIFAVAFCFSILLSVIFNNVYFKKRSVLEYENTTAEYLYYQTENENLYIDFGGYISEPSVAFRNGRTSLDNYVILDLDDETVKRFDYISGSVKISKVYLKGPENSYETDAFSEIKSLANRRNCDIILFNESIEIEFDENKVFYAFGNGKDISDETLVAINHDDYEIRFLANGFHNAVNCDIAVITSDYENDSSMIKSERIFVFDDSVVGPSDKIKRFDERLTFNFKNNERKITVNEH